MSWPDGGRRSGREGHELRGGWRVPCAIRWPGVLKPGTVSNDVFSTDMLPTLAAAAGDPDVVEKLARRATSRGTRRSRSTSTDTTCFRSSKARSKRIPDRVSSTGAMTAT